MCPALRNKIVIFGCPGITGHSAVRAALKQGLEVRAFIGQESQLQEELHKNVEVFIGHIFMADNVVKAVKGCDAVVLILPARHSYGPTLKMSVLFKNILLAMRKNNVKVISVCLSTYLYRDKSKVPQKFHATYDDHELILHLLQASEDLNWIAVMPQHVKDIPSSGYSVEIGSSPSKAGLAHLNKAISKNELGKFIIGCLINPPEYYKKQWDKVTEEHAP